MGETQVARLTVGELLREHPWPKAFAGERRLEWLWVHEVELPAEAFWPLISDMSRLNRALGNPEMDFEEKDGLRYGRARYGGVMHAWHEVPWEWVAGRWYTLHRVYSQGAMRALYSIHHLQPLGERRTRLYVYFGVVPRWRLLTPAMRINFAAIGRAYRRVIPALAREHAAAQLPAPFEVSPPSLRAEADARLRAIAGELRAAGLDATAVDRLVEYVRGGDELDLCRIQVRERARAWKLDEDLLLRVFLHATRAGLLELSWDVVCPHCRGVRETEARLSEVPSQGSCDVCAVTFGTADAVEVSFRVHRSIREVEPRLYCSAEPATKTHIRVQRALAPGDDAAVAVELSPGRYRLRNRGEGGVAGYLDVGEVNGREAAAVAWRVSAPPGEQAVGPHAELALVNDSSENRTFILETAQPSDLALRPGRLFSHQEFRDLFSDEFLGADVRLAVGEQTILFTDIVGSTAMYAERGDPDAFVAVKHHFTSVFELIARHRGAVVKTIGDAAMGAFTDPVDALRAAEDIQRAFGPAAPIRLRVSLNTGPCIAVKLNANLDYFGHAVNVAAKLQALAEAGQIAISSSTMAAPGVAAHLAAAGATLDDLTLTVKGITRPLAAKRWTVTPSAA